MLTSKTLARKRTFLPESLTTPQSRLAFYERVIKAARDGLWFRDLASNELWVSSGWWENLGYSPSDVPKNFSELCNMIHPDDLLSFKAALQNHLSGSQQFYECEFRLKDSTGAFRTILSKGECTRDKSGHPLTIAGFHSDISESKARHSAFEDEARLHKAIFDTIPHLVFVKNEQSIFTYGNKALADFYGTTSDKLKGTTDSQFNKNARQVRRFIGNDRYVIQNKKSLLIPLEKNTDATGKLHWLTTIKVPITFPNGSTWVVGVATFVDELVTAQQKLSRERMQSRRHKAWTNIAKVTGHRLGTNMFTLSNWLDAMDGFEGKIKTQMEEAIDEAKRLLADFKLLSLAGRLRPKQTNLIGVICNAFSTLPSSVSVKLNQKNLSLVDRQNEKFDILADEQKLTEVFVEFAINSGKWVKAKQPLVINIEVSRVEPEKLRRADTSMEGGLSYRVVYADNGMGVQPRIKRRIFDPFYGKDSHGTGLGLAIIKEVIEAHGGDIEETGTAGEGAVFEILLPSEPPLKKNKI